MVDGRNSRLANWIGRYRWVSKHVVHSLKLSLSLGQTISAWLDAEVV